MCTVVLRLNPQGAWPVLLGAIRDEFVERAWDPPARHWPAPWRALIGGRDHAAGGTWLAVDPDRPAVACLLNAGRRDPLPDGGVRPTRGTLALRVLADGTVPAGEELEPYDRFHLLRVTLDGAELWSWDGDAMVHRALDPGDHIVVNAGLNAEADPLVPHFRPLLAEVLDGDPSAGDWGGWSTLLVGDDLPGDDERALVVRKTIEGHDYGTTSATLVAFAADGRVRYDFNVDPRLTDAWLEIDLSSTE